MKLNSIQFLRAVAALLVVYAHSIDVQTYYSVSYQQNFFYLENFGAIGADMFFVISGFIITFVANKYSGIEDGVDFFIKRFIRINPIYYIISFILLTTNIWLTRVPGYHLEWDFIYQTVADTMLIIPIKNGYAPILNIGWTLAFEWFFYIVFIILILLKTKNKPFVLATVLTVLVITGRIIPFKDYRLLFISNPLILEFLLGVGICWIYFHRKLSSPVARIMITAGLICYAAEILLGFGTISELGSVLSGKYSLDRFFLWGVPSALIVSGCIFVEKNNASPRIWHYKWIQLTGDASYSIYLVHLGIYFLFHLLYAKFGFFLNADLSNLVHVATATIAGIGVYTYIEKPLLKALQKIYSKKNAPVPIPAT